MPASTYAVIAIYVFFGLVELFRSRLFDKQEQTRNDAVIEVVSTFMVLVITQPTILLFVQYMMGVYLPEYRDSLANINIFAAIGLFLIFEDMMQYWWHRASHSTHWLYNLHRAHHNGRYMSIRLVYRNNIIYYAMMPSIWLAAALVYLGLGWVYAGYIIVKQLVIIGAHSDVAWDKPLYEIKALSPVNEPSLPLNST